MRVDQGLIDSFAQLSGDDYWIHTDPERAQQTTLVQIPQSLLLSPLAGPMSALNQARNESMFASVRL